MTNNNVVIQLFEALKENTPIRDGYDLQIEFSSVYGGYRINWVNKENGGHSDFSGIARMPKKEIMAYMRGYLKAMEINQLPF